MVKTEEALQPGTRFAWLRFGYVLFYMIYVAVTPLMPVRIWLENYPQVSVVYSVLAVAGALLLAVDLFRDQVLLAEKNCMLAVLFLVAAAISSVVNFRYGIAANAKTLVWTAIQLFLLASIDTKQRKELHNRQFRIFSEVFLTIWTAAVCWSLWMFVVQYQDVHQFADQPKPMNLGFSGGRLWGVFSDPNYASLSSIVAMGLAVILLIRKGASRWGRIWHGLALFLQLCYVILSGSRTAIICLSLACALVVLLLVWRLCERKKLAVLLRLGAAVLAAVLSASLVSGINKLGKEGLSYVPALVGVVPEQESDQENPDENKPGSINRVDFTRQDVEGNEDITNNRFAIWKDYAQVFLSSPIVGTSPRNVMAYTEAHFQDLYVIETQYSVHNTYLALFVCTGLLGAIPILLWLVMKAWEVVGYLIRRRNAGDEEYNTVLVLAAVMVVLAIAALPLMFVFFNNMIIDLMFWVLLGYALGFARMAEPERSRKDPLLRRLVRKVLRKKRALCNTACE